MNPRTTALITVTSVLLAPCVLRGQEPANSRSDTESIILAPHAEAPIPAVTSSQSPATPLSAEIASVMPAFDSKRAVADKAAATVDLRETERPRNAIPRVPAQMMEKYVVNASKVPVFRPRDLFTREGLIDLSFKAHPGFRVGNFFNLNADAAYEKFMDEQLAEARRDAVDTIFAMAVGGDETDLGAMRDAIIADGFNRESKVGKDTKHER